MYTVDSIASMSPIVQESFAEVPEEAFNSYSFVCGMLINQDKCATSEVWITAVYAIVGSKLVLNETGDEFPIDLADDLGAAQLCLTKSMR